MGKNSTPVKQGRKKNFLVRMFNWIAEGNKKAAAKGQLCKS
jgi:hypothetical protein